MRNLERGAPAAGDVAGERPERPDAGEFSMTCCAWGPDGQMTAPSAVSRPWIQSRLGGKRRRAETG